MWFGEGRCSATLKRKGLQCKHKAYYEHMGKAVCGRHKSKPYRKLPVNPEKTRLQEEALQAQAESVRRERQSNRAKGSRGSVVCTKIRCMQAPQHRSGHQSIFPNRWHGNRRDGIGLPDCSPMSVGPIHLPSGQTASCVENMHQGSKLFHGSIDDPSAMAQFREVQASLFADPKPHRHNPMATGKGHQKNVPVCFVWTRSDGTVVPYDYVPSRQFYCNYLERGLLAGNAGFDRLKTMVEEGTSVNLLGYDAFDVPLDRTIDSIYLDGSRAFGHELVIYTMLTHRPNEWPWRNHKSEEF